MGIESPHGIGQSNTSRFFKRRKPLNGEGMAQKGKKRETSAPDERSLFQIEEEADGRNATAAPPIERWATPKSWTWASVGDVGEVKAGMPRTPRNRPGMNATKYIRAANITESGLDLTDLLEMDFDAEEREVFALRPGDIVLSEASGSPEQVGKPAQWNGELPLCCFQNTVLRFRPIGLSSEFALIVFQHYFENGLFASLVRGVGIGHLGSERFALFPFPLPPRMEQDRIVAEFAVQAQRVKIALASLQSAREKMALQRQTIFSSKLGLSVDASAGSKAELPPEWSNVRLGDICEAENGRAFKSSEWSESGLPIIRIQNLRDRDAEFNYFDGEVEDRHLVKEGDLLFAWSGTPGTSFGAFLWHGPRAALNQHIFKLTPDESRVNPAFLYYAINQNLEGYIRAAKGGGGLAHITRGQFLNSKVVLAPLKDQAKIVQTIRNHQRSLGEQEAVVDHSIQRTRTLRQALLVRAVEGTLVEQTGTEGSSTEHLLDIRAALARYKQDLKKRRETLKGATVAKRTAAQSLLKRDLHEVLTELGPLPTHELFKKSGYREEKPDEVETFYRLLDKAIRSKRIAADAGDSPEPARFKAVTA